MFNWPQPTIQALPIWRLTRAACELAPPKAVRMPWAIFMPRRSSGLVSRRTRINLTLLSLSHSASASEAWKQILPRGGAGTGVDPLGQQAAGIDGGPLRFGIVDRLQQLIEVVGRNALGIEGFFFGDHPFVDQVDGDPHGGETGPLGVAGLQHPHLAALHRELDVLHVAIVLFELFADFDQLLWASGMALPRVSSIRRGCGCRPPRLRPGR